MPELDWLNEYVVHSESAEPKSPLYAEQAEATHPKISEFLEGQGWRPFAHQTEALRAVHEGKNVVLATPTSSGKTLAFNNPVFEALLTDASATALYLYPLKALARDQEGTLKEWFDGVGLPQSAYVYDGDNPSQSHRQAALEKGRLILTNPVGLHRYLERASKWHRFLSGLRYLIIDEAHTQRGIRGSHTANTIRRVLRLARYAGAKPQVILATATLANPIEFAKVLTGESNWHLISESGAATGPRHTMLIDPSQGQLAAFDLNVRLLADLCMQKRSTLCFVPSRHLAESFAAAVKNRMDELFPGGSRFVAAYRAGYTVEDRRRIEQDLAEGRKRIVISTTALEAGIDIGAIDSVVLYGYPGSIASFRQMAGRAGRGTRAAHIFFVALATPLDTYLISHPDDLLRRTPENAFVFPQYDKIHASHILCAAHEHPIVKADDGILMETSQPIISAFIEESLLLDARKSGTGIRYLGGGTAGRQSSPQSITDVMGGSGDTWMVKDGNKIVELLEEDRLWMQAWPRAIILNQGRTYRVVAHAPNSKAVRVVPEDTEIRSRVQGFTAVTILGTEGNRPVTRGLSVNWGPLLFTTNVQAGVNSLDGQVIERVDLTGQAPPVRLDTNGIWLTFDDAFLTAALGQDANPAAALHSLEHMLLTFAPLFALMDTRDFRGAYAAAHGQAGGATVFLADGFSGGLDISRRLEPLLPSIFKAAEELLSACSCAVGCSRCLYIGWCSEGNTGLSKRQCLDLLQAIRS